MIGSEGVERASGEAERKRVGRCRLINGISLNVEHENCLGCESELACCKMARLIQSICDETLGMGPGITEIFDRVVAAPTVRGVNRPVPEGYKGHPGDPVKVSRKLRPLTTLERARLQTFPPDFKWTGSKTDLEQVIGNAVPVKLAEFVAGSILQYAKEKRIRAV